MFTYVLTLNIIIWSVIFATLFIYLAVLACTFLELMFSLFKVVVYTLSWPTYAGMNPSEAACLSCMSHSTFVCVSRLLLVCRSNRRTLQSCSGLASEASFHT